jgi:hypothetical protein
MDIKDNFNENIDPNKEVEEKGENENGANGANNLDNCDQCDLKPNTNLTVKTHTRLQHRKDENTKKIKDYFIKNKNHKDNTEEFEEEVQNGIDETEANKLDNCVQCYLKPNTNLTVNTHTRLQHRKDEILRK